MKKKFFLILIFFAFSFVSPAFNVVLANDINYEATGTSVYQVYDENFNLLFQKDVISVGDQYMSNDFKLYEIVYVDYETQKGFAKFIKNVELPNINYSYAPKPISFREKKICLYMTHNDETYLPSDGVDSVYGNGGIKDVALAFKNELENKLVNVYFDDSLHIPHDNNAYSRSSITAKSLYNNYAPDAIFDIHRDATSRNFYVANVDGKERCKVRIVLGKSNPNFNLNEEFALYLVAVANKLYPWLIADVYYGKGHYNQSIDGKALLFEMGTYLIEKEKVIESTKELADVVTTALYGTTINEDTGDLTINGSEDEENKIIVDYIDEKQQSNWGYFVLVACVVFFLSVCLYVALKLLKKMKLVKINK